MIGPNWQCCLVGSSKTAPRILIFLIFLGAENLSYVKSIETHARAFLPLNISAISSVHFKGLTHSVLVKIHSSVWYQEVKALNSSDIKIWILLILLLCSSLSEVILRRYSDWEGPPCMCWDGFEKVIWWGRFEKELRRYSDWEGPPCMYWDGFEKVI